MGNFLKHLHPLMRRKRKSNDYQDVNYAIIDALQEQITEMESDSVKSKIQSSLETATGEYLDIWGDWFGLARKENEQDTEYRNRIIEYFLLKRGTNNAIIKAVKDYFDDDKTDITIYEPFKNIFFTNRSKLNGNDHLMGHYYRFAVIDVTIGRPFPAEIIDIINKFKPAGVQLFLTFDGASLITDSGIIPMPSQETKFENYINLDIWNGYGDMFYGHLNLRNSNDLFSSDFIYDSNVVDKAVFKLNNSKLNGKAVLSGDPTMNRTFYNTAFITNKEFKPTHNSTTVSIKSKIKGLEELPFDFYNNTETKDNTYATINLPKSNTDTYNMYLSFNVLKYFDINLKKVLKSFKGGIDLVKDYISNPKLNYEFKPVLPPNITFNVKYEFFNFKFNKWEIITQDDIDYIGISKSLPLGSLQDYISNIGNLFVRLQFDLNGLDSLDINFNYLDISFEHYDPNVYTVTPYLGEFLNNTVFSYIDYLTCYKTPSIENRDIISKPGLQPIRYLRVTGNSNNEVYNTAVNVTAISKDTNEIDTNNITYTLPSETYPNKIIAFFGIRTDLISFTIKTDIPISYLKLEYSQDNKNWYTLQTINNLSTSISVLNNTVDLYGLNLVNYRNITPFSNITLNSIYRIKLKDLTSQGVVTDIPFGFFNVKYTTVDYLGTVQANNFKIVKDTGNGMLDKSSGNIIKVSTPTINGFERVNMTNDILESETNVKINLDLPYSINTLSDTKLSETEYSETRIPKIL